MSAVYDISEAYVVRHAQLNPLAATAEGVKGHDAEMTDFSPDAEAERAEHARAGLRALAAAPTESEADRVAAEVMADRLQVTVDLYELGEHFRDLNVLSSPMQHIREGFDLMPRETVEDWETITARMSLVAEGLSSIQVRYDEGIAQGLVAARRQVVGCVRQAEVLSGTDPAGTRPYFLKLADRLEASGLGTSSLHADLTARAERATAAFASFARYLTQEYSPHAAERDPVGAERYGVAARVFNGTELDLQETYDWGWDELHRIEHAMGEVAERILPGQSLESVFELLETDPKRAIEGEENLLAWLQDLMDRTIAELDGVHFDIPEPVQRGPGDDRAAGWRGGDVLHGSVGGLLPSGSHLVPDARPHPLPALGRGLDLLPRGCPRPSPAGRAGALPRGAAQPVPAHARVGVRPRRRLGAVRGAAHG